MNRFIVFVLSMTGIIGLSQGNESTFTVGSEFALRIPATGDGAGWMEPATLSVEVHAQIVDLDVKVDIIHEEVSDLEIHLVAPGGQLVILKDGWDPPWQVRYPDLRDIVFDDETDRQLAVEDHPFAGRYRPTWGQALSSLDQTDAYGVWELRIKDIYFDDIGQLNHWELQFTTEPIPVSPDFNGDELFNLLDFVLLAGSWLETECEAKDCYVFDLEPDGVIDLADLLIFTELWLFEPVE